MELIKIQVSPKQMSKLRNGKKVRVKKAMEGGGINLLVEPSNYSLMTNSFDRNKGMELSLSPSEIMSNKEQASSMEGTGIFGSKFDKKIEESLGKRGKKKVYGFAKDVLNPIAKTLLYSGIASGATTLSALQPELIPLIIPAAVGTADFLGDYLDKPSDFYSKPKQLRLPVEKLNAELGTNMGYMNRSGIGNALQNKEIQNMNISRIQSQMDGNGLYAGRGLYPVSGNGLYLGNKSGGSIVGKNGGMVYTTPQALQSQPNSSNFQFRYTTIPLVVGMLKK